MLISTVKNLAGLCIALQNDYLKSILGGTICAIIKFYLNRYQESLDICSDAKISSKGNIRILFNFWIGGNLR